MLAAVEPMVNRYKLVLVGNGFCRDDDDDDDDDDPAAVAAGENLDFRRLDKQDIVVLCCLKAS